MSITCGHQAHWLLLSGIMCSRCPSWNWMAFTRHPEYICVLLSEWAVWVGARVSCPDTTCLSAAAMTAWRVTLLFSVSTSSMRLRTELRGVSLSFLWNQLLLCGWPLLALLPSHFRLKLLLMKPMTSCQRHTFPFLETLKKKSETTDVSFSHTSPDYRKSSRVRLVCLVCLWCFPHLKKGFTSPFITSHKQTPPVAIRCLRFHFWDHS